MTADGTPLVWQKARCDSASCVEAAGAADRVFMRDSTDPDGARLVFTVDAWHEFIDEVRAGGFDAD